MALGLGKWVAEGWKDEVSQEKCSWCLHDVDMAVSIGCFFGWLNLGFACGIEFLSLELRCYFPRQSRILKPSILYRSHRAMIDLNPLIHTPQLHRDPSSHACERLATFAGREGLSHLPSLL